LEIGERIKMRNKKTVYISTLAGVLICGAALSQKVAADEQNLVGNTLNVETVAKDVHTVEASQNSQNNLENYPYATTESNTPAISPDLHEQEVSTNNSSANQDSNRMVRTFAREASSISDEDNDKNDSSDILDIKPESSSNTNQNSEESNTLDVRAAFAYSDGFSSVLESKKVKVGDTVKVNVPEDKNREFYQIQLMNSKTFDKEYLPPRVTEFVYGSSRKDFNNLNIIYGEPVTVGNLTVGSSKLAVSGQVHSIVATFEDGSNRSYQRFGKEIDLGRAIHAGEKVKVTFYGSINDPKELFKEITLTASGNQEPITTSKPTVNYTYEQELAAKVWYTLTDGQYPYKLIKNEAGSPVSGKTGVGKVFPDVTYFLYENTTRSYALQYVIDYKDNGDGTITVYNVPKHWHIKDDEMDDFTQNILDTAQIIKLKPVSKQTLSKILLNGDFSSLGQSPVLTDSKGHPTPDYSSHFSNVVHNSDGKDFENNIEVSKGNLVTNHNSQWYNFEGYSSNIASENSTKFSRNQLNDAEQNSVSKKDSHQISDELPSTGEKVSQLSIWGFIIASLGMSGMLYKGRHRR